MGDKSLKKNAFYSFLWVFIGLLFPLVTFPYASRILLPEGIGKVNFANSIISYFIRKSRNKCKFVILKIHCPFFGLSINVI